VRIPHISKMLVVRDNISSKLDQLRAKTERDHELARLLFYGASPMRRTKEEVHMQVEQDIMRRISILKTVSTFSKLADSGFPPEISVIR
jgi:hypothetical protein